MNNIQIQYDYYNVVVININLFLYAKTKKYDKDHLLYIYLANKDQPTEIKLRYECFESLEKALQVLFNN